MRAGYAGKPARASQCASGLGAKVFFATLRALEEKAGAEVITPRRETS